MNESNWSLAEMHGEEGTTAELLRVRASLRALPRVACPTGFDFRLQKRIENGYEKAHERWFSRGWVLGWSGATLGVATALVIAIIAFDFNTPTALAPIASNKPASNQANPYIAPQGVNTQTVSEPSKPIIEEDKAAQQQLADEKSLAKGTAKKDSIRKGTGLPPNDYIQTVSGNGR
jgi:hypothetical protein